MGRRFDPDRAHARQVRVELLVVLILWKMLPLSVRHFVHRFLHRLNSSKFSLLLVEFRHLITVRRLSRRPKPHWIRLGESRRFENWLSTNYQVLTRNFLDATKNFGRENCQYIYADNVIEHLTKKQGDLLVRNAFDALIPGGIIRIATPDLESIAHRYCQGSLEDVHQMAADLEQHKLDISTPSDLLRITFTAFGHEKGVIYDFASLKLLLESAGFVEVKKYGPGDSEIFNLRNLESRTGISDMWSQMAVEAAKPSK